MRRETLSLAFAFAAGIGVLPVAQAATARNACAPPHGNGTDICVEIAAGDPLKLATLLDNTTTIQSTGAIALDPTFGIDDRRGVEVARILRPKALGHDIELVGPDTLAGLPNYRENCNNLDSSLPTNQAQANAIVAEGDILGVIGPICSDSAFQAAPILTAGKVLIVSPNTQSPALTAPCPPGVATNCRPEDSFYARTAPNGRFQAGLMAAEANVRACTTAATVDDGSAFSHGLSLSFAGIFTGSTTTYSPVTTPAQMDATISAINAAGAPNIVYITSTSLAEVKILVTKARDGIAPDLPASTVLGVTNTAGQLKGFWEPALGGIGTLADGVLVSGVDRAFTASDDYLGEFLPEYLGLSSGQLPPNHFHAFAFDAYNIVVDAIEKVAIKNGKQSGNSWLIPRQALRDELLFGTNTKGLATPSGGVTATSAKLNCDNQNPQVDGDTGDCAAGAAYFTVDEIACPPVNGTGTCNLINQPLP